MFHDVAGTIRIVDDCTLAIDDFYFDGGGIVVKVYGGTNGDFSDGIAMGPDLVRDRPYEGESISVNLPEGVTWDDVDSISIWCLTVGVDFGSATLPPP